MNKEAVLIDVVFNPETKQLEKRIQEIGEKGTKLTIEKPDVKELEGPFKELQEKFMALANGGFRKGISQFGEAAKEFQTISSQGGGFFTAAAGGLSKIGMEGAAAAGVIAGVAVAIVGVAAATYKWIDAGQEYSRVQRQVNIDLDEYAQNLHGVVDVQQVLLFRNAAMTAGLNLTAKELSNISVVSRNLGQQTGDMAAAQQLYAEAASGNIDSIVALGLAVDTTATKAERASQAMAAIAQRRREEGAGDQTIGERVGEAWDKISRSIVKAGGNVAEYLNMVSASEQEQIRLINQRLAREETAARIRQEARRVQEATEALAGAGEQNAARSLILAGQSVAVARNGLSTQQEIAASLMDTANTQAEINALGEVNARTEAQRAEVTSRLTALYQQLAGQEQRRNQLSSFAVQLADAQRARLVQIAMSEAHHTRENRQQLSLSQQIKMAEAERLRIANAIIFAGGAMTENQRIQLEQLQTFINNGRQQQAAAAAQELAQRRQNEQSELAMRYANEQARANNERTRSDIDAIDLLQRRTQLEAALNGLHAYRGRTTTQESARLEEIQRRTQELQTIEQIFQTQRTNYDSMRQVSMARESTISQGIVNRLQQAVELSDRRFAIDQGTVTTYNEILARQREGLLLTQSEQNFLNLNSDARATEAMLTNLQIARLAELKRQTEDTSLSEQDRITAAERYNAALREQIDYQRRISEQQQQLSPMNSRLGRTVQGLAGDYRNFGDAAQGLASGALQQFGSAFSNLISTAIEGKVSFGDAMLEMTKSMLSSLAQMAGTQALFQAATGFAKLAIGDIPGAGNAFASAALFGAVGLLAGAGAAIIPSPNSGGSEAKSGTGPSSGGVKGSSQGSENNGMSGTIVMNFNLPVFSTKEEIEGAVAGYVYGYENRTGRNTRNTRK